MIHAELKKGSKATESEDKMPKIIHPKPEFLCANILDLSSLHEKFDYSPKEDPVRLKKIIGFSKIQDELFPIVKTGVNKWQYLLIARDIEKIRWRKLTSKKLYAERVLKAIHKHLEKVRVPKEYSSLRPYISMYNELNYIHYARKEHRDGFGTLKNFIKDKRREFGQETLKRYENSHDDWKKLFKKALGEPGKQYFSLVDKKTEKWDESIITDILKNSKKYPALCKGAYAYALFRCLYGFAETSEEKNRIKSSWHEEWVGLLKKRSRILPEARGYLQYLKEKGAPCWASYAKTIAAEKRQVLNSLKFYTVFRLYTNDWLKGKYAR